MSADVHVNAIPAIPYVLENSVLLEQSKDKDGKPIENLTIAAPIKIDNQPYYLVMRLRKDLAAKGSEPKFYTCAAELTVSANKKAASLMTSPISEAEGRIETGGRDRLLNILHDALVVNDNVKNVQEFDSVTAPITITPDNAVDVLQGMIKVIEQKRLENYKFLTGSPVCFIQSGQIKRDENGKVVAAAKKYISEWLKLNKPDGVFNHPRLGEVQLSLGGIKDSLSHMSADVHVNAIPAIPYVLENSVLLEQSKDKDGKPIENLTIAAPILISGKKNYVVIRLKRSTLDKNEKPRFYIVAAELESEAQKNAALTLQDPRHDKSSLTGGKNRLLNILHDALAVNQQEQKIIKGRTNNVKTAKGTKIETQFALVEADQVIASHTATGAANPAYPQELQPRDRSRDSSVAWVQKTANNLDPESLGRTGRADTGAPIVGPDLCVESGNGRTMAIQLAYARGNADEYRDWLADEADYFGFTREQVAAMDQPVLVRIRTSAIDRVQFAIEANQDDKLSQTATERAKSDAKLLDDDLLQHFMPSETGDFMAASNHKFLAAFLRKLGDTEAAQYADKNGNFTQSFVARVRQAIFAKAYNDDRLIDMMADQTKPELQNMLNSLTVAAPQFIRAQATSRIGAEQVSERIVDGMEQSLNDKVMAAINEAMNAIMHARGDGQDIAEYVQQMGLFGDMPEGVPELTIYISQNMRSVKKLAMLFSEMAQFVEKQELDAKNFGLFGEPEPVSVIEAFNYAKEAVDMKYQQDSSSLFDDAGGSFKLAMINTDNMLSVIQAMIDTMSRKIVADSHGDPVSLETEQTDEDFITGLLDGSIERSQDAIRRCYEIAKTRDDLTDELSDIAKQFYDELHGIPRVELFDEVYKVLNRLQSKVTGSDDDFNHLYAVYTLQMIAGQWHTTKKGKRICGFIVEAPASKKDVIDEIDPYTFKKNGGFFIRLNHIHVVPDKLLNPDQIAAKEVMKYVYGDYSRVEQISGLHRHAGRKTYPDDGAGSAESVAGGSGQPDGSGGDQQFSDRGVSEPDGTGTLVGRDQPDEYGDRGGNGQPDTTTGDERSGGGEPGSSGSAAERGRNRRTIRTAKQAGIVLEGKALDQHEVNDATLKWWADADEIAAQLPYLQVQQQDDVLKAEKRLMGENGNGMLFTNGTGTGKTFTGLGTVKRFLNAGKQNILIVTMNDKIVRDFVKSGVPLDIDIYQLSGIDDNGGDEHNVVMTTYANFGQNMSLGRKDWDLIVMDEAHNLMQSSSGEETAALKALRALTGHHSGFDYWARMRFASQYPDQNQYNLDNEQEADQYQVALNNWDSMLKPHRQKWIENWEQQGPGRAKVVFLSATPFSYVKSVDWAEGYLFHYTDPKHQFVESSSGGYNSGDARERFFMQNFGYRMRYNKLTQPDKDVDVGVMERMFNEKLKKSGALSGRDIEVDFDYDRKFIKVQSGVGELIDEGLRYLSDTKGQDGRQKYEILSSAVRKRFDYLSRRRLLEAIKAVEIIPYIRKSLALGRKVVVFHDYNEGGGFKPFAFNSGELAMAATGRYTSENAARMEYEAFSEARPDLVSLSLDYDSPLATLKAAFPKALIFNGTISKGKRQQAVDLFNDDESGRDIMIVQSDAGATGISLHDVTGNRQRVSINIGQPAKPAKLRQTEGRIYRIGQASNAIQRYVTTGTDWERYAFAQTIAGRAETVDNLAMGEQVQSSIKQALIEAYEAAAHEEPSANDGIGGKAYEAESARLNKLTPFDRALTFYYAKGKNTARRDNREGVDWYATPEPLGLKMIEWAGVHKGDKVLEPSAGDGAIGRFVPETASLTMIEPTESLAGRAQMANTGANVILDSFENHEIVNKYHAVVMNPPFGVAGATAIQHMRKAFDHLYDGGRMVALVPCGAMDNKLNDWLYHSKKAHMVGRILLPDCTFKNAGTSVRTQIVIIDRYDYPDDKPATPPFSRDYTGSENIKELFDEIRDADVRPRQPRMDELLEEYGLYVRTERSKYVYNGDGLKNPLITKVIDENLGYAYEYNEFDEMVFRYNQSKYIIKCLREYEKDHNVSLKMPKIQDQFDGLFDSSRIIEPQPDIEFVATQKFKIELEKLCGSGAYSDLQNELRRDPLKGDVVQGTGGARKIRFARNSGGKSGGVRVIYYYLSHNLRVYFLDVYPKNKQENMTPDQLNKIRIFVRGAKNANK